MPQAVEIDEVKLKYLRYVFSQVCRHAVIQVSLDVKANWTETLDVLGK